MLEDILLKLRKDNAITFAPADDKSIRFASSMLSSHKFSAIPSEFVNFLKMTDGLMWNGVELYGSRAVEREEFGYSFPGLIEANLNFLNNGYLHGKLILGKASEELFVYYGKEYKYLVVDRINFEINSVYTTFTEMLNDYVNEIF